MQIAVCDGEHASGDDYAIGGKGGNDELINVIRGSDLGGDNLAVESSGKHDLVTRKKTCHGRTFKAISLPTVEPSDASCLTATSPPATPDVH